MNIDKTIEKLTEMKKDAKTDTVRHNIQMKIDILNKKKRETEKI
jgi:hypothetical protein